MATIVDKLFVTFGLDPAEFIEGQKKVDAAQKKNRDTSSTTRKQMEEDGKKTVAAFRSIRNEVLALVGTFISLGAIKSFTEQITHSDAAIGRMAASLGMSVPDLWTWEKAMEQFGVKAGETDSALSSLTELAQQWAYGAPVTSEMSRQLTQAGVDVVKFHDASTTLEERINMLATAFHKIGPAAAEALGGSLNLPRQFIAQLAVQGPEAIDKMRAAMKAMGPLTDQQAAAAIRREQEWNNMQTRIQGFERYLVETFWPLVEPIIQAVMNWWQRNQVEIVSDLKAAVIWLGAELAKIPWKEIGADVKAIAQAADTAAQAFGGWGKTIEALGVAYLGFKALGIAGGIGTALRAIGVDGGGAAAGAGTAAAGAAGVAGIGLAPLAAVIALLGSGIILTLMELTKDHGDLTGVENMRKSQGGRGYMVNKDLYGARHSNEWDNSSTSIANDYNINIFTNGDVDSIVKGLDTYFHNLSVAAPAQQGGR